MYKWWVLRGTCPQTGEQVGWSEWLRYGFWGHSPPEADDAPWIIAICDGLWWKIQNIYDSCCDVHTGVALRQKFLMEFLKKYHKLSLWWMGVRTPAPFGQLCSCFKMRNYRPILLSSWDNRSGVCVYVYICVSVWIKWPLTKSSTPYRYHGRLKCC